MGKRSVKAIRTTLKGLATGSGAYDSAYASAMERIESQVPDQTELAKHVLAWIVHAKRQLIAAELQEALGVEAGEGELDRDNCPDVDDMVSACAGLVMIDEASSVIRLVHYTTQEYFDRTRHDWFPNAEAMITTTCMTYLSFETFTRDCKQWNNEPNIQDYPGFYFHLYAARYWPRHAHLATSVFEQVVDFLRQPKNMVDALGICFFPATSLADYVCRMGRFSWAPISSWFRVALTIAVLRGHESVVRLILETANGEALPSQHAQIGQCLVAYNKYEVKIDLLRRNKPSRRCHPDCDKHHDSPPGPHLVHVELLLRYPPRGGEDGGAVPMCQVLEHTATEVVDGGTQAGASLSGRLLSEIVTMNYSSLVEALLSSHVDINFRNTHDGNTPLQYAVQDKRTTIVNMLLERGADTTIRNSQHETALWIAVRNGDYQNSESLIDAGADVNCQAVQCNEALLASWHRVLLLRGAATNTQVQCGDFLLHIACKRGSVILVKLLLSAGADVNCVNELGRSPIYYARALGHAHIVKALLAHGAGDSLARPLPPACTVVRSSRH
jgi:ankyrin repeat protein